MALVVRLINLAISDFSPEAMLLEDAALYWTTATIGQTFLDNAHLAIFSQTERMPGYFLFLAAIIGIFGENFLPSSCHSVGYRFYNLRADWRVRLLYLSKTFGDFRLACRRLAQPFYP